jgi:3-deoxy-D-manno-octulosonic-acid transferase
MKRLASRINPKLLILVESDFWYNLMSSVKTVVLINGKISERSASRFKRLPFFTNKLFSLFKLLCVQSDLYKERFTSLDISADKIIPTGNLKFDQVIPKINLEEGRQKFGLTKEDRVITIGSTHAPEEELLDALAPLFPKFPHLKILLVARHPERFPSVAALLEKKGIPFARYTDPAFTTKAQKAQVLFIDTMGLLGSCYQLSEIAIVAGSFGSELGGHNIFEPTSVGVPVLFGPHMHSQKDLVDLILSSRVGEQVTLSTLPQVVQEFLTKPPTTMRKAALALASTMQGSTQRTWECIKQLVNT